MVATNIDIREHLHGKPPADDLFELLIAEWDSTVELFNKDSQNQFCRRTLFRNAFSFVEGLLHHLKARTYRHYFRVIVPVVLLWKEHFDLDFPESGFLRLVDEDVLLSLLDKKVHIDEEGKWQLKDNWAFLCHQCPFYLSNYCSRLWNRYHKRSISRSWLDCIPSLRDGPKQSYSSKGSRRVRSKG